MAKFHIAMFPWFAIGHITPYTHLANELARKGHKVTILLPKKAHLQIQNLNLHPNQVTFYPLNVPHVDGLPLGTETTSDAELSLHGLLATAYDLTRDQVQNFLSTTKPQFVFYDFANWLPDIAVPLGIKTVFYSVVSPSAVSFTLTLTRNLPDDRRITPEDLKKIELVSLPPSYPSSLVVHRVLHELRLLLMILSLSSCDGTTLAERLTTSMKRSDVLCMRSCRELEGNFCDYISNHLGKPVLLTGPVLPKAGVTNSSLEERWADWLGRFEPGSVVFCVFGSQIILEKSQFQELVSGFELTGLPFFVALKPPKGCASVEEAFPLGFEERVKGRGVVYGGWVQQPLILSHPSIGCFVNHCGFGTMWESLLSDSQIVLVPFLSDQILNTRLLSAGDLKVAVEVEREGINRWFSKENLSKAIKSVMDKDSEVGIMMKKNHAKLRETLEKPGLMSGYIDQLVHNLQELLSQN
ncbi:hypothetical protein UlMin_004283 [Ulmus minor]